MTKLLLYRGISKTFLTEIYTYCGKCHIVMMSNRKLLKQSSIDSFTAATKSGNEQRKEQKEGKKEEFEFFFGAKFVFSQFHPAKFEVDGITFNCMEQYMHHQKAVTFSDKIRERLILREADPKKQKKLGREVTPFDKVVWGRKAVAVVKKGSLAKYRQNADMKKVLFATYPKTLVECSPRDRLWGIGLGRTNDKAKNRATWRGKNLLGETLTEVRNKLMAEEKLIPGLEGRSQALVSESVGKSQGPSSEVGSNSEKSKNLDLIPSNKPKGTPSKDKKRSSPLTYKEKSNSKERKMSSKDSSFKESSSDKKNLSQKGTNKSESNEQKLHSKDRDNLSSSQERKAISSLKTKETKEEKKHTPSKDKREITTSEKRKETDVVPEKVSTQKGKLISLKGRNEPSPSKKRKLTHIDEEKEIETKGKAESVPSNHEREKTPSKRRKRIDDVPEKLSKDKGKLTSLKCKDEPSPSKEKKITCIDKGKETEEKDEFVASKDKGNYIPSKKRKRDDNEREKQSKQRGELTEADIKGEHLPSKKSKKTFVDEEKEVKRERDNNVPLEGKGEHTPTNKIKTDETKIKQNDNNLESIQSENKEYSLLKETNNVKIEREAQKGDELISSVINKGICSSQKENETSEELKKQIEDKVERTLSEDQVECSSSQKNDVSTEDLKEQIEDKEERTLPENKMNCSPSETCELLSDKIISGDVKEQSKDE